MLKAESLQNLWDPSAVRAIFIRVNVTGVMAARYVGKIRREPGTAGLARMSF